MGRKELKLKRYRSLSDDEFTEPKNINIKYFEKEEKWNQLMNNTIVLTPDRISRIRKKIVVEGIQIDVESFLLGGIIGSLIMYLMIAC
jgi:hypothetical protein